MDTSQIVVRVNEYPMLNKIRDFRTGEIFIKNAFIERCCPLCGKNNFDLLGTVDIFPIRKCRDCDMIYNGFYPNPDCHEAVQTDNEGYYKTMQGHIHLTEKLIRRTKSELGRIFLPHYKDHQGPINFLDFGCGEAWLPKIAKELGWNAVGVDHNVNAIRVSKERHGVDVFPSLDAVKEPALFDFVWVNFVLALPNDPIGLLRMLHDRMKPGGLIRICDSNFGSFSVQRNGLLHYYFTPPCVNHFTRETLSKMLLRTGFSKIVAYREGRIAPYVFFSRTSSRCRYLDKKTLQPASGFPPDSFLKKTVTSAIFTKSFNAARRVLVALGLSFVERMGLGDELQIIARK